MNEQFHFDFDPSSTGETNSNEQSELEATSPILETDSKSTESISPNETQQPRQKTFQASTTETQFTFSMKEADCAFDGHFSPRLVERRAFEIKRKRKIPGNLLIYSIKEIANEPQDKTSEDQSSPYWWMEN